MLRSMNGENDQMSSRLGAKFRSCPATKPHSTLKGKVAHSPCRSAGSASRTPPSTPVKRPPITPSRTVVSNDKSPATKLLALKRIQTPRGKRNADPQHQVDFLFHAALLAKQQRLELQRTNQSAGHGGGYAQLDQQINEDESLFHGSLNRIR